MKYRFSASALLLDENEDCITLVKERNGLFPGYWNLPGGKLERKDNDGSPLHHAEIPLAAFRKGAARETKEECGYRARIGAHLDTFYVVRKNGNGKIIEKQVFVAHVIGGTLKPQLEEVLDAREFTLRTILHVTPLTPCARQSIKDYLSGVRHESYVWKDNQLTQGVIPKEFLKR